ncbi:PD-(D/E)XK nuclease family transposase [Candidatus Stoquefichus massiliensis]|uniref:PD-(D/E)XK nuclease family transposase n=1 Tax=Candidatus Stoquefichus massiliensis TaxID=1470350 RepID=UPI0004838D3B|nr:PD-(D/E)XK nuclease family transposase [Candidatus Stoquefichus massiliensis]
MNTALSCEYLDSILSLRLIDDDFMDIIFNDRDCLELLLSIIFNKPVYVIAFSTQYMMKNLHGRDIRIDVFARTLDNHYINVEVQRKNDGAHPKRARYHHSMMDANISFPSQEWKKIPPVSVIFITENDVLGKGLPIYHIHRTIDETGEYFSDEETTIYVNASIRDETPLGLLMHDFMCRNCEDMHYEVLRRKVRYFKETEGGIQEMCEIFDEIRNKGKEEGRFEEKLDTIQKLISKEMTFEEVMSLLDIPIEKQQHFRKHIVM